MTNRRIAVVGLGYVGLPVALAFARKYEGVIGFDVDVAKVDRLRGGVDLTGEASAEELAETTLQFSHDPAELAEADFYVVAVPTPVDENNNPSLAALSSASRSVASGLSNGDIVVYESTVYPGVTEQHCGVILEQESGLKCGEDFKLGYSPERINPGDKEHTFERIVKVVSGQDEESAEIIAQVYESVVDAGVHRAPTIQVAEAAKVIENTQRDLNIALMNELAILFDRIGVRTKDVLDAAATKWNFLRFVPGLVGGHCIGVDPYYLTCLAEQKGLHPQVILAGRRINDGMGAFIAQKAVKLLIQKDCNPSRAKIAVLGLTFKEDVPDTRNSRVPDILKELHEYGIEVVVVDPVADAEDARHEYGIDPAPLEAAEGADAVIVAVPHRAFGDLGPWLRAQAPKAVLDVKSCLDPSSLASESEYWSL